MNSILIMVYSMCLLYYTMRFTMYIDIFYIVLRFACCVISKLLLCSTVFFLQNKYFQNFLSNTTRMLNGSDPDQEDILSVLI